MNNDNIEGNESVFKVPSLPSEHGGNGVKKKKLKSKGNKYLNSIYFIRHWIVLYFILKIHLLL